MINSNFDKSKLENSGRPAIRANREYLLSRRVAHDFNQYLLFDPFGVFADVFDKETQIKMAKDRKYDPIARSYKGVRSIFNKSGAVLFGGGLGNDKDDVLKMSEWRASTNTPLIDSPANRQTIRQASGYTIRELVEASEAGILGRALYAYSDFMYCKYLGQMPNNYLITLRRFPIPVDDYISSQGTGTTRIDPGVKNKDAVPIGQLVTWMNTPGNNLDSILNYSVKMPYEEKTAQWEQGADADASAKPLNSLSAMFDSQYRSQYQKGMAGGALQNNPGYIGKLFGKTLGQDPPPYSSFLTFRDQNKLYGPIDAVKKVYYRGEGGLDFDQSFNLTFEYELRSYNGINGRQAMLDLISNILNVTYTTGTFWGGGVRGGGAHQNNIFTNLEIFKTSGGLSNFVDAFFKDVSTVSSGVSKSVKEQGGILHAIKNFFNDLGGMLMGGLLNKLGRPQKAMMNSLLSPAPTGLWHVTIGNPFHPIMSLGNMILTDTKITHTGPLGLDDFPTGLKVECSLTRGKPRDLREIEMMYMGGNDRIYHSMGPAIFDMYTHAKEYKSTSAKAQADVPKEEESELKTVWGEIKKSYEEGGSHETTRNAVIAVKDCVVWSWQQSKDFLNKNFGDKDEYPISNQAEEQEWGAYKKEKTSSNNNSKGSSKKKTGGGR